MNLHYFSLILASILVFSCKVIPPESDTSAVEVHERNPRSRIFGPLGGVYTNNIKLKCGRERKSENSEYIEFVYGYLLSKEKFLGYTRAQSQFIGRAERGVLESAMTKPEGRNPSHSKEIVSGYMLKICDSDWHRMVYYTQVGRFAREDVDERSFYSFIESVMGYILQNGDELDFKVYKGFFE